MIADITAAYKEAMYLSKNIGHGLIVRDVIIHPVIVEPGPCKQSGFFVARTSNRSFMLTKPLCNMAGRLLKQKHGEAGVLSREAMLAVASLPRYSILVFTPK